MIHKIGEIQGYQNRSYWRRGVVSPSLNYLGLMNSLDDLWGRPAVMEREEGGRKETVKELMKQEFLLYQLPQLAHNIHTCRLHEHTIASNVEKLSTKAKLSGPL